MVQRKIIHIDMDAFYASVEQRDHPELRGKPLAVGHAEERGVVAAASYEARRYGVRSAMSSQKAKRLCPQLIFVPGRMDVYKSVSRQIHEIFHEYTDIIEPLSLDEAFLDVTENKKGISLAVDIAKEIKQKIRDQLNLVASAGISYNKFLAKIASDYRKPDGLCTIHPEQAVSRLYRSRISRSSLNINPERHLGFQISFPLRSLISIAPYSRSLSRSVAMLTFSRTRLP